MKKITIEKILQKPTKSGVDVSFILNINKKKSTLKYRIKTNEIIFNKPFEERIDSVVVTFLIFAMKGGYDFYSDYPISEKLYYQLIYHVIPQIYLCNPNDTTKPHIYAPVKKPKIKSSTNYVATGISCGIDSLATFFEYTSPDMIKDYRITHLVYFKTGAHDGQIGKFDRGVENNLYRGQLKVAESFAKQAGFPLMGVDSNLNEVLSKNFGFTNYEITHSFRNVGTMLLLQDYFSKYYYADTYKLTDFSVNLNGDMAHYEKWLLPLLSNEKISFYSANQDWSRFDKTAFITNYPLSYDNLLVCWMGTKNCGKYEKCIRTQTTLDILGKLDLYKNSFDLEFYQKNREQFLFHVVEMKDKDYFFKEIAEHLSDEEISKYQYKNQSNNTKTLIKRAIKKLALKR